MINFRILLLPVLIWVIGLVALTLVTLQLSENINSKLRLESQEVSASFFKAINAELRKTTEDLQKLPSLHGEPLVTPQQLSEVASKYVIEHTACSGIAKVGKGLELVWLNEIAMRPEKIEDLRLSPLDFRSLRDGKSLIIRNNVRLIDVYRQVPNLDVSSVTFFLPIKEGDMSLGGYLAFYKTQNFIDNAINSRVTGGDFDQRSYGIEIADDTNIFFSRFGADLNSKRPMFETQLITEGQIRWRMTSWPTEQAMERHDFWIPGMTTGLGFVAVSILAFAVFSAQFAYSRLTALKKEVRDRVAAEGKLMEAQTRFRSAVEHAIAPLFIAGLDGIIQDTNDAACEEFGFTRDELIGMDFWRLEATPAHSVLRDATDNLLANPVKVRPVETRLRRKNGEQFDSEVRFGIVKVDESPCLVISAADLTERNRQRDHIAQLNQDLEKRVAERTEELYRLAAVLEASPDYVGVYEFPTGRPLFVNEAMRKLPGLGCPWFDAILPGNSFNADKVWNCLLQDFPRMEGEGVWIGESTVTLNDHRVVPVSRLLQIHKAQDGTPRHVSAIMHDISARKSLEKELRNRGDSLESLNVSLAKAAKMKDEFLASMSHELRTPLNGILALSQSMLDHVYGPLNERQTGSLRDIEQCGKHLLSLITDVLDFSKIEAEQLKIEKVPVDISAVSGSAIKMVSQLAHQKRQYVRLSVDDNVGQVDADPRRLKQMLVNLLGNAVKFTPAGGNIGLEVREDVALREVRFTVWDTGIGIEPQDFCKLFRPFQQLDSSLSREYSGTGLGLALVSRMAELHGGSVEVESTPGVGSRFTIVIPGNNRVNPDLSIIPSIGASESRTMAVLLAEGDFLRVRDFLDDTPVRVISLDPLGDWRQQILKERPSVLMLDPEPIEGPCRLLLSALLQGQFPEVKSVIVLMRLTEICNEDPLPCGRIQLLSRSFDQATLKASLNFNPSSDLKTVSFKRQFRYPASDGPLILLAEDNELNARIVKDWFEAAGYQILIAENGLLALELTIELMPSLVIMDGQMPGLDGFQVTQKLRDNELTKGIPIIALTALAMPGDREKWLAVGVEEYLSKPVSMHQLQLAVENTLMVRRTVSAVEGQANETLFLDGKQTPADQAEKDRLAVP